jgi:uncharacterized membrane protein YjfL (UPF0719 family)
MDDLRLLILSLVYAIVGVILLYGGYRVFDLLTPGNAHDKIFKENNVAVSILIAGFIIGLAIVIAAAIT